MPRQRSRAGNQIELLEARHLLSAGGPDLTVQPIGSPPPQAAFGAPGTATFRLTNAGDATLAGKVSLNVLLSSDTTADASDRTAATSSPMLRLKPGKSKKITLRFSYPSDLPEGDYFVLCQANADHALAETDFTNDSAAMVGTVHVGPPFIDLSIRISSLSDKYRVGRFGKIDVNVFNSGNTFFDDRPVIRVVASKDQNLSDDDIELFNSTTHIRLAPGRNKIFHLSFVGPLEMNPNVSGNITYYAIAKVDATNIISEKDESNNVAVSNVTFEAQPFSLNPFDSGSIFG